MESHKGITLFSFWVSPFGQRVCIALTEKNIEFEYKEENLWDKSEMLLKMNPVHKKIPVLVHDGKPVCESLNILQYIEEAWPEKTKLLPEDAYERAQARFWADYVDKKVYECGTRLWKLKGEAKEAAKKEFIEILQTLESELGDKKYFGGETFGYVDVAFVPLTARFYSYETEAGFSIEEFAPKISAWAERCAERESVKKHLSEPEKVYEFVCMLKKMYGVE